MKVLICQDFNAGADYKIGDTVETDARNAENWIARGFALPAPENAPFKKKAAKKVAVKRGEK